MKDEMPTEAEVRVLWGCLEFLLSKTTASWRARSNQKPFDYETLSRQRTFFKERGVWRTKLETWVHQPLPRPVDEVQFESPTALIERFYARDNSLWVDWKVSRSDVDWM